jgi:hypothetical protein
MEALGRMEKCLAEMWREPFFWSALQRPLD